MESKERFLTHSTPVWREKADTVLMLCVLNNSERTDYEQIWGRQISDQLFEVCCIPFFADDINLGDVVQTDLEFNIQGVYKRSNQNGLRIWLLEQDVAMRNTLVEKLSLAANFIEWSSENFFALSVSSAKLGQLRVLLQSAAEQGLLEFDEVKG
jgi:hypothetical protein